MTETEEPSIYEKTFAKSDKTDAILVVQGNKLHVNKAILSYHSDYFNTLFSSEFKEKSMEEIEIKDVNFEDFATLLSLVQSVPIKCSIYCPEQYLDIADRFQLPAAKRHLELYLITSRQAPDTLIKVADKYRLNELMNIKLSEYGKAEFFEASHCLYGIQCYKPKRKFFETVTIETNNKLFHRWLEVNNKITKKPKLESETMSIYEKVFAESDKTDAILVVDGKKLHVNKTLSAFFQKSPRRYIRVLSYHSDYFDALFNSEFKEKSMEEIEIKDVNFVDFATLLSLIHLNPIAPTVKNAVNILELSVRFIIPCAGWYLEPFITISELTSLEKIRIGEKYGLPYLLHNGIMNLKADDFTDLPTNPTYQELSFATKKKLFDRSFKFFSR